MFNKGGTTMPEDKLYDIMKKAARLEHLQPIDESVVHPVDDVNLLEAWSLGDLSEKKRVEILEHLADCVYCRRETAAMMRDGVLNFTSEPVGPVQEASNPTVTRPWAQRGLRILMTAAAVLLVAFGIWKLQSPQEKQIAKVMPTFRIVAAKDFRSDTTRGHGEPTNGEGQAEKNWIESILEKAGNDPEKRFDVGLELLAMQTDESVEQAVDVFERLNKEYPDNAGILNALAIAYHSSGEPEKALESYEKAKQIDPTNVQIQENLDRML